jgi:DNA-binding transcriptional LysR family regulator
VRRFKQSYLSHNLPFQETYTRIRNSQVKLFNVLSSKILTQAGEQLKHARVFFEIYREIDFEMSALIKEQYGLLRLGASTTISQYLIPPLARFHQEMRGIKVILQWKYRTN